MVLGSAARACASAARSIRPSPVAGTRSTAAAANRPPASTEGCSIAETSSLVERLPMGSARRRERQHVGLGAARGEHHVARLGADQRGDLLARLLDSRRAARPSAWTEDGLPARSSAAMRRRAPAAAAARSHSSRDTCARSWPLIALRPCCSPKPMARPIPFETLAFCPRTRAKKRPPRPPAPAVGGAAGQILEWF